MGANIQQILEGEANHKPKILTRVQKEVFSKAPSAMKLRFYIRKSMRIYALVRTKVLQKINKTKRDVSKPLTSGNS